MIDLKKLAHLARQIRKNSLQMMYEAGGGHIGSAMSTVELITAIYFTQILNYDPANFSWNQRDYFILSNGHACPTLYAVLAQAGFFSFKKLKQLYKLNLGLEGHPLKNSLPGIEISSGSLGMGLSVGLGLSLGLSLKNKKNKVLVMMSDGEQDEGSVWEAVMAAGHYQPKNLTALIDRNGIQIAGSTEKTMKLEPLDKKYQSFGWQVDIIDGHDFPAIINALTAALENKKPTAVIANTIPAKGIYGHEGKTSTHHPEIKPEEYKKTMQILNQ
jgi:transketolase